MAYRLCFVQTPCVAWYRGLGMVQVTVATLMGLLAAVKRRFPRRLIPILAFNILNYGVGMTVIFQLIFGEINLGETCRIFWEWIHQMIMPLGSFGDGWATSRGGKCCQTYLSLLLALLYVLVSNSISLVSSSFKKNFWSKGGRCHARHGPRRTIFSYQMALLSAQWGAACLIRRLKHVQRAMFCWLDSST